MNHLNDITIRQYEHDAGIVECRICGLKFLPNLEEDRQLHEQEHWRIICGGLPYEIREFIKRAAWDVLRHRQATDNDYARTQREIAKRAVVFAWWAKAVSNGIPENQFEAYMAGHLAFMDATISGDREQIEDANDLIACWQKYG